MLDHQNNYVERSSFVRRSKFFTAHHYRSLN